MKISFCTTCMGRKHHLEQALLKNIEDNLPVKEGDPSIEFVLVDYNSRDGLQDWVKSNAALKPYLDNGTLIYAHYADADHFHHAHAKNMAHRLATGDVVCNVDADNFTGKGFARYLADKFADDKSVFVHTSYAAHNDLPYGSYGRIALRRSDFLALGGYSETRYKKGWGGEDQDMILRALAYGLEARPIFGKSFLKVIEHSNEERVEHTAGGTTAKQVQKIYAGGMLARQIKYHFNIFVSSVQVNAGGHFGEGKILDLKGNERVIGAEDSFGRITRRGIHALLPWMKDIKMKPKSVGQTVKPT